MDVRPSLTCPAAGLCASPPPSGAVRGHYFGFFVMVVDSSFFMDPLPLPFDSCCFFFVFFVFVFVFVFFVFQWLNYDNQFVISQLSEITAS